MEMSLKSAMRLFGKGQTCSNTENTTKLQGKRVSETEWIFHLDGHPQFRVIAWNQNREFVNQMEKLQNELG